MAKKKKKKKELSAWQKLNEKMQDKYVEAKLAGHTKAESRSIAGYAPVTQTAQIERPNGPVALKLAKALQERGIDEDFLVDKYQKGLEESPTERGRLGDYNAYFKGLSQLGMLMGYGRRENPAVAIQLNDNRSLQVDPGAVQGSIERLASLAKILEARLIENKVPGFHAGNFGFKDRLASSGVDPVIDPPQEPDSGSQP